MSKQKKEKQPPVLGRLLAYAGGHKWLSVLGCGLSGVSAAAGIFPFVFVWYAARGILTPGGGVPAGLARYGWDALAAALRSSFALEELTLAGLHTGLHLLAQLKDPPPDAALRAAARQYGVRCSLLSDYDLTGTAHSAAGTLVLGYGSLPDADCAAAGERLKKLCTAAREASDTV